MGLPVAPAAAAAAAAALPFVPAAAALLEPEAAGADASRDDAAGDRCLLALALPLVVAPGEVLLVVEVDTAAAAAAADDGDVEDGADVVRRDVVLAVACLKVEAVVAAAVAAVLAFRMERLALPPVAVIAVAVRVASLTGTKTASRRSKVPSTSVLGAPLVLLGIHVVRDAGG